MIFNTFIRFRYLSTMSKRSLYLITGNVKLHLCRRRSWKSSIPSLETNLISKRKMLIVRIFSCSTWTPRRARRSSQRKSYDCFQGSQKACISWRHLPLLQRLQRITRTLYQMVFEKYRAWRIGQDGGAFRGQNSLCDVHYRIHEWITQGAFTFCWKDPRKNRWT